MTLCIRFVINGEPVTKKNSQQIVRIGGRACIVPSRAYKAYEREALEVIPPNARNCLTTPLNVKSVYYRKTRRRVDISNLHSALHDVLVAAGVVADDNRDIIAATDGSRVYWDKDNPRTEVTITLLEEEYEQWQKPK